MWTSHPLSAWPGSLSSGLGGEWAGWTKKPDNSSFWPSDARERVFASLSQQYVNAGITPPSSLAKLQVHSTRVVTVGHQLVIAGGPSFFHHKILSAIRVARRLSKGEEGTVVPLFWMASEDHDWQEVSTLAGETDMHRWQPPEAVTPHPVGRRSLEGIEEMLAAWVEDLPDKAMAKDVVEEFQKALVNGETLSGLMRRWLHRWYGEEGLLVLDADDPALKTSASHLWAAEFDGSGIHSVLRGSEEMEGPAHVRLNNVFWMDEDAGRHGVVKAVDSNLWEAGGVEVAKTHEDWSVWSNANAAQCSPGVLLRPIYQEHLLHSLAVIVGPGEWGYWHQLPRVFEKFNMSFPSLRMRDHGVVLTLSVLQTGWSLADGWMHSQEWDRWVLDRWLDELGPALEKQQAELLNWQQQQGEWIAHEAPMLEGPAASFRAAVSKAWDQWLVKVRRSLKGSRAKEWAQAQLAHSSLVRDGKPQDRWANWHVLSQGNWRSWTQAWLSDEVGAEAVVWTFVPTEVHIERIEQNSAKRN